MSPRFTRLVRAGLVLLCAPAVATAVTVVDSEPAVAASHVVVEGDCVGELCAPPNGGIPGTTPRRLPFAEPAAPCDGTEPEFTYPIGNPHLDRADVQSPALRRTYSWYREPGRSAPMKWGAHCDVWWSASFAPAAPRLVVPTPTTSEAVVLAGLALEAGPLTVGASVTLPAIPVPRVALEDPYTVQPALRLTEVRWEGTETCRVVPLRANNAAATVRVMPAADGSAVDPSACVTVHTRWDLTATRFFTAGPAVGREEPVATMLGSRGQPCGPTCVIEQRTTSTGTTVVAEAGLRPADGGAAESSLTAPAVAPVAAWPEPSRAASFASAFRRAGDPPGLVALAALVVGLLMLLRVSGWFQGARSRLARTPEVR